MTNQTRKPKNPHIGSNFDDFLKKEGIFEEVQVQAIKEVDGWQRQTAMRKKGAARGTRQ